MFECVLFLASYDSSSSAPTTDMSIEFAGTEPPPINMPHVIPTPRILPSPAASETHFPSRVLQCDWLLCYIGWWLICILLKLHVHFTRHWNTSPKNYNKCSVVVFQHNPDPLHEAPQVSWVGFGSGDWATTLTAPGDTFIFPECRSWCSYTRSRRHLSFLY